MNKDIMQGKWEEIKGKVKQTWSELTDDDIGKIAGKHDELVGRIRKHYGYEKDRAEKEIDNFMTRNGYVEDVKRKDFRGK